MPPTTREPPPGVTDDELRAGLNAGARWARDALFRRYEEKVPRLLYGAAR